MHFRQILRREEFAGFHHFHRIRIPILEPRLLGAKRAKNTLRGWISLNYRRILRLLQIVPSPQFPCLYCTLWVFPQWLVHLTLSYELRIFHVRCFLSFWSQLPEQSLWHSECLRNRQNFSQYDRSCLLSTFKLNSRCRFHFEIEVLWKFWCFRGIRIKMRVLVLFWIMTFRDVD